MSDENPDLGEILRSLPPEERAKVMGDFDKYLDATNAASDVNLDTLAATLGEQHLDALARVDYDTRSAILGQFDVDDDNRAAIEELIRRRTSKND